MPAARLPMRALALAAVVVLACRLRPAATPGRRHAGLLPRGGHHGRRSAGVVPRCLRIRRPSRRVEGRRGPQPGDRHRGKAPVPGRRASGPASRCSRSTRGPTRRRSPRRRPNSPGHRPEKARADREVARLKPLAEAQAIGAKEADDAQSQSDLAAAAIKSAQAKLAEARLNLSYTRVTAPIAGVTSRAAQSEGSVATANTTLLTSISQLDPIWVVFSVSENERLKLDRARASGKLAVPSNNAYEVELKLADGSIFPRTGRIDFTDVRVNPQTGTYEMRASVPNADGALKPGQFVRVVLKGAERRDAIASAPGRGDGGTARQVRLRRGQGQGGQGCGDAAPDRGRRLDRG